jgi:phosphate transport system permease protein
MSTNTLTERKSFASRQFARTDNIRSAQIIGAVFKWFCVFAALLGIASLAVLLIYVIVDAVGWLDWQFLTSSPSRFPEKAGIYPALVGSVYVMAMVGLFSLPLGVGAAVWLEEYAGNGLLRRIIEMNIANLAGVPSIVYGLLGLGIFVTVMGFSSGIVIIGAFTLTLRILPIVIVSAQEAIRAVPDSHRRAAYALGATRWYVIRTVTIPEARAGILTGMIIAIAQGMGETAPLIMIGAATTSFRPPQGLFGIFSAMPLQIYAWSDLPKSGFQHGVVPASIVTLLVILLSLNGLAVYLRNRAAQTTK